MRSPPTTLAPILRAELRRLRPPAGVSELAHAWREAVGSSIAANAWPARRGEDGTLYVTVSSSVWAFELKQMEEAIRTRLVERLGAGAPRRLRFAVGRLPETAGEDVTKHKRNVPLVTGADLARGAELAAAIESERLRAAAARALATRLARERAAASDCPLW